MLGGVLVQNGIAYVVAGRSTALDGGLFLYALEPKTGKVLWTKNYIGSNNPAVTFLPELLVSDTGGLSMGCLTVDPKTGQHGALTKDANLRMAIWNRSTNLEQPPSLNSVNYRNQSNSLLDHSWRLYDSADAMSGVNDDRFFTMSYRGVTGQIVVFNDNIGISYHRQEVGRKSSLSAQAFADPKQLLWTLPIAEPFQVHALALAGDTLLAAGPKDYRHPTVGGELWFIDVKTGKKLNAVPLPAPPVADGIAIANGQVYIATRDGQLLALK